MSQIQEGAGKEIRCPGHNCFKVVPNVSIHASRRDAILRKMYDSETWCCT